MKIGLIGFGSIGQRHYQNFKKLRQNVVVLSKRKNVALNDIVDTWPAFAGRGPFEAIFITNETFKHLPTIKKCLTLNPRAIFIEKPLSHNSKGLSALVRTLKRKKISTWVGYNWHFSKTLLKIKEILRRKKLGKIYYIRASVGQDLREWRPGRDYSKIYSAKKTFGGGVLLDLVHDINYPAWLLDDVLIPRRSYIRKISNLKIDTEDLVEGVFEGRNSGVIVSAHLDYLRVPGKRTLEIAGSVGSLFWDSVRSEFVLEMPSGQIYKKIKEARNEMYESEIKFFLARLKNGKYFSNIDEAVYDVKLIEYMKKHGSF